MYVYTHIIHVRGNGLAVESTSRNPGGRGSIPHLGSRRSLLISIEHAELLRSTLSLVLCCVWLVTMALVPSFSLVFKIGLVLMVFRLIGSHLISHLALRQSQSMIPSLHSLLFPVVYPKVPYLAHSFLLSIQLLSAR